MQHITEEEKINLLALCSVPFDDGDCLKVNM
jgi:hypothetical protein